MAFAPILLAASAAVGALGAIHSAQAQSASYKSAAAAASYNTQASMQNAITAEQAASANELAMRRSNDQRMGSEVPRLCAISTTGREACVTDSDSRGPHAA